MISWIVSLAPFMANILNGIQLQDWRVFLNSHFCQWKSIKFRPWESGQLPAHLKQNFTMWSSISSIDFTEVIFLSLLSGILESRFTWQELYMYISIWGIFFTSYFLVFFHTWGTPASLFDFSSVTVSVWNWLCLHLKNSRTNLITPSCFENTYLNIV